MGGIGSGRRWHFAAKNTTDNHRALDIRAIARAGCLRPGNRFGWQWTLNGKKIAGIDLLSESPDALRLMYRLSCNSEDWQDFDYLVRLDWTPCHLGRNRVWFLCPAQGCGKRVAKLYSGAVFACRHCYSLAYPSQREDRLDRAARRHEKLRARLGWAGGLFDPSPVWQKPKGMHWQTFSRLARQAESAQDEALSLTVARFGSDFAHSEAFKEWPEKS